MHPPLALALGLSVFLTFPQRRAAAAGPPPPLRAAAAGAGRRAAAASGACPALEAGSVPACGRCVADDLCPTIGGVPYACHPRTKRCVDPAVSSSPLDGCEGSEDPADPATWGARCNEGCSEQGVPFSCASSCLHEDFPCRWVPGCGPPAGLSETSAACLRSCGDHDAQVAGVLPASDCNDAERRYGCEADGLAREYCPDTCRTRECEARCGRDEAEDEDGKQCWRSIEVDGSDCLTAIRSGLDCHCKCGDVYRHNGERRTSAGAFTATDLIQSPSGPQDLARRIVATAGVPFAVSLTGERLRAYDASEEDGPRLKVVEHGLDCGEGPLAEDLTAGLQCPAGQICRTPPRLATPFLHRWTGLRVDGSAWAQGGFFDVCHCNEDCEVVQNWRRAGSLQVLMRTTTTGQLASQTQPTVLYVPPVSTSQDEVESEAVVEVALSVGGGVAASAEAVAAIRFALVRFLRVESILLGRDVPEEGDITLSTRAPRRALQAARRAQGCEDNDEVFAARAAEINLAIFSCGEAVALVGGAEELCNEPAMQDAVSGGCHQTCNLCLEPGETTTQRAAPAPATTTTAPPSPAPPPPAPPPAPAGLRVAVEVRTWTDASNDHIVARLEQVRSDPELLTRLVHAELLSSGLNASDVPALASLRIQVVDGPYNRFNTEEESQVPPRPLWTASIQVTLIVVGAFGGSLLLSACGVCCWCACVRSPYHYRVDVEQGEKGPGLGEVPKSAPVAAGRPRGGGGCCCCQRKLRRLEPLGHGGGDGSSATVEWWASPGTAGAASDLPPPGVGVALGSTVKLMGLSAAPQYNGLMGTVVAGPNENGRYTVDIVVVDDEEACEHQTKAFKPENLFVVPLRTGAGAAEAVDVLESPPASARAPAAAAAGRGGGGGGAASAAGAMRATGASYRSAGR